MNNLNNLSSMGEDGLKRGLRSFTPVSVDGAFIAWRTLAIGAALSSCLWLMILFAVVKLQ